MKIIGKRISISFVIVLILILYAGGKSFAQQQLSLMDAVRAGLENNFKILISEQNLEIAKNNNVWGTAGFWPSIALGARQYNRYDNAPDRIDESERDKYVTNSFTPYINLNWMLFRGMSAHITKHQLEQLEEYSEGNATIVVENTIQGIVLSYYKVLLDQEKLEILDKVKQLSSDRYDYVQHKKALGGAVTYDVIQAYNSFMSDSTNYLTQQLNLRNSLLILKLLLGVPPEEQYTLTDEFQVMTYDLDLDTLMNAMSANNSTLRNQYINQEILNQDIQLAKSNVWPTLSLNTGFDQYNIRMQNIDQHAAYSNNLDFYANFTLNFNLSNGGNTRRAIQNARVSEIIGELQIADMKQTLSNLLVNVYELYTIRKQLYQVSLVNLESNELNLQISTDKFRAGAINSFNFRDVQLQYLNAAFRKLGSVYDLIDTHTELLRLTGGIISEF